MIEERLRAIEALLVDARVNPRQEGTLGLSTSPAQLKPSYHYPSVFDQDDATSTCEGSSSFQAHAAGAQRFAEATVDLGSDNTLMASLQQASGTPPVQKELPSTTHAVSACRDMPLPPASAVVDILRRVKGMLGSKSSTVIH